MPDGRVGRATLRLPRAVHSPADHAAVAVAVRPRPSARAWGVIAARERDPSFDIKLNYIDVLIIGDLRDSAPAARPMAFRRPARGESVRGKPPQGVIEP